MALIKELPHRIDASALIEVFFALLTAHNVM